MEVIFGKYKYTIKQLPIVHQHYISKFTTASRGFPCDSTALLLTVELDVELCAVGDCRDGAFRIVDLFVGNCRDGTCRYLASSSKVLSDVCL